MLRSVIFCLLSASLLILAFPKTDIFFLAWIAMVPFLLALEGKRPWAAFGLGYVFGFIFFLGTLYWFIHVTALGMIVLIAYLALYPALFAWGYAHFSNPQRKYPLTVQLFLIPAWWVVLEFARAHFLTGFGWAALGHSQYQNLPFIQISDLTGVAGVSFLVMMVNVFITEVMKTEKENRKALVLPAVFTGGVFILIFVYGLFSLSKQKPAAFMNVAIVQPNVSQDIKWRPYHWEDILQDQLALTRQAAEEKLDIIIWPETSFPGFIWEAPEMFEALKDEVAKIGIPLLLGTVVREGEDIYYNSALLISSSGDVVRQYNKLHLVPFGEYIPLRGYLSFLARIVPIADFTRGEEYTLFSVDQNNFFAALICFEDTLAGLARNFVQTGANLLVNITNDAWFADTKAPFMHLQAAAFRAVENRRSLIRAANTGVSCVIGPAGRVIRYLKDDTGKKTYVAGYARARVPVSSQETFYTKYGDIFTYLCFGCILILCKVKF